MTLFFAEFLVNRMLMLDNSNGERPPKEVPSPFQDPIQPIPPEITPMPETPTEPTPGKVPEIPPVHEPPEKPAPIEIPPEEEPEEPEEEPEEDGIKR